MPCPPETLCSIWHDFHETISDEDMACHAPTETSQFGWLKRIMRPTLI